MKEKSLKWAGDSKEVLSDFPPQVKRSIGYSLYRVQIGEKPPNAKPLHGFGGASVLEIAEDDDGKTYRAVYTVQFKGVVYVLHAFQKKSTKGIAIPKHEMDLVKQRLKALVAEIGKRSKDKQK